jgi:hypothetical protein
MDDIAAVVAFFPSDFGTHAFNGGLTLPAKMEVAVGEGAAMPYVVPTTAGAHSQSAAHRTGRRRDVENGILRLKFEERRRRVQVDGACEQSDV